MNWPCLALVIQQTFAKSLLWVTTVALKHGRNLGARDPREEPTGQENRA